MIYILLYLVFAVMLALLLGQWFARRQADQTVATLRLQLDDAIDVQLDQYEELERLRPALEAAVRERNAANLRAQRAVNSIRRQPTVVHASSSLPADVVHPMAFSAN